MAQARHIQERWAKGHAASVESSLDLERAARFLYLQRLSFRGKIEGRSFGVDRRTPGRFGVTKLEPMLAELHDRLAGVVIEQLGYAEVIRRYDAPETLFYLDPPYVGTRAITAPGSPAVTSRAWPRSSPRSPDASCCRSTTRRWLARCSAASGSRPCR